MPPFVSKTSRSFSGFLNIYLRILQDPESGLMNDLRRGKDRSAGGQNECNPYQVILLGPYQRGTPVQFLTISKIWTLGSVNLHSTLQCAYYRVTRPQSLTYEKVWVASARHGRNVEMMFFNNGCLYERDHLAPCQTGLQ